MEGIKVSLTITIPGRTPIDTPATIYKPAKQSLKISEDAYKHMLRSCIENITPSTWSKMNAKQRLEAHLKEIMEGLRGISYTYQILED